MMNAIQSSAVYAKSGSTFRATNVSTKLRQMRRLARWMDSAYQIPVIRRRIGLESLLGLVPGLGDLATAGVSAAIVVEAMRLGVPRSLIVKMLLNIGVDTAVGTIPVLGDLFDIAFKANMKNVDLLEKHFHMESSPSAAPRKR